MAAQRPSLLQYPNTTTTRPSQHNRLALTPLHQARSSRSRPHPRALRTRRPGPPERLLDFDWQLVDLVGGVAGLVVDPQHRLFGRPGGQAEHLARLRVEPCALEVHALGRLDRQVPLVCLAELASVTPVNPL